MEGHRDGRRSPSGQNPRYQFRERLVTGAVVLLPTTCKRVCVSQTLHRRQQDIGEELVKGPWTAVEDQKVQLHPNTVEDCKIEAEAERRRLLNHLLFRTILCAFHRQKEECQTFRFFFL